MTRQSDKTGTIRTTKRLSPTSAGEIRSTSEDTSGWGTDASSNVIDNGRLALSTSSSTTITACQTLYPELWANAPTGWRSGSNLVVPSGHELVGTKTYSALVNLTVGPTVVNQSFTGLISSITRNSTGNYTVNVKSGILNTGFNVTATISSGSGAANGATTRVYNSGTSSFNVLISDSSQAVYDSGNVMLLMTSPANFDDNTTPYIQAYNNVANAQSIPPATATEAGSVTAAQTTWTPPTPVSTTNIDSYTLADCKVFLTNGLVTVRGYVTVDPTSAGTTTTLVFSTTTLPYRGTAQIAAGSYIVGRVYRNGNPTVDNQGMVYQNSSQFAAGQFGMTIDNVSSTSASVWIYEFTYAQND